MRDVCARGDQVPASDVAERLSVKGCDIKLALLSSDDKICGGGLSPAAFVVWDGSFFLVPNTLFYGDNLEVLRRHGRDQTVDLCYIDPPFNSKRNYNQIYNNIGGEDRAQAQAFT